MPIEEFPAIKGTTQDNTAQFTTKLNSTDETQFNKWIKDNNIKDLNEPDSFYDYRGYWKDIASKGRNETQINSQDHRLHYPDTYKQPGHPTFSIESKYAVGRNDAGRWEGDTFIPPTNNKIEELPTIEEATPIKKERPFMEFFPKEPAHRLASHDSSIITGIPEAFDSLRDYSTNKIGMDPYPLKGLRAGLSSLATEPLRFAAEAISDPFTLATGAFGALKGRLGGIGTSVAEKAAPAIEKSPISDINFRTPEVPIAKPKVKANLDGTFSPLDNPTIKLDKEFKPIETPIQKLNAALKDAIPLTEEQKKIYSVERGERVASAEGVTTPGLAGHYERLGRLAGEHTKVQMQPIKLDAADVDSLVDTINGSDLQRYGKENATTGLTKILSGQVPQKSEIDLLEHVFGKDHIDEMRAALPLTDKKRSILMEATNLPRSIQTAYDLSFPFRQGAGLIHTKGWWNSWAPMIKSYGSEKAYRGVMDSILERPNYQSIAGGKSFAQKSGLALTDLSDLSNREEAIMSTIAEKIPGIRASNRAYTAFANKLRADNFDSMINQASKIYETAKLTGAENPELLNPKYNLQLAKDIASYINNASGRGSLGKWEKNAVGLNSFLFSPKLISSRLRMMDPRKYVTGNPLLRKAYLKSLLSIAGTWTTLASLAKMGGAEVSLDPTNADFGKIKIGNVRLDPGASFQQYLVLLSRLISGEYTNSTTGDEKTYGEGFGSRTRKDALLDFIQNKLAPIPGYFARALGATQNKPFDVIDETLRLFSPMVAQDLSELTQEDPTLIPALVPSLIGLGEQTYGDRGETTKLFGEEQPELKFEGGGIF